MKKMRCFYNFMFCDTIEVSDKEFEEFSVMEYSDQLRYIADHFEERKLLLDGEEHTAGYPFCIEDEDGIIFYE